MRKKTVVSPEDRIARAHLGAMIARLGRGHNVRRVPVTVQRYLQKQPQQAALLKGLIAR